MLDESFLPGEHTGSTDQRIVNQQTERNMHTLFSWDLLTNGSGPLLGQKLFTHIITQCVYFVIYKSWSAVLLSASSDIHTYVIGCKTVGLFWAHTNAHTLKWLLSLAEFHQFSSIIFENLPDKVILTSFYLADS